MKHIHWIVAGMLAAITTAAPAFVLAAEVLPWYGGIGGGRSVLQRPVSWSSQTDVLLGAQGVASTTNIGTNETAWKVFGGYQFNEYVAVEAAYSQLGKFSGVSVVTAPAAGTGAGTWDVSAFSISALGILPIRENSLSAFGKLGLAYTNLDVNVVAPGVGGASAVVNPSNTRTNLLVGLGLRFDVTKRVGLRAEWDRYSNVGDGSSTGQSGIDVWSLSALFRF